MSSSDEDGEAPIRTGRAVMDNPDGEGSYVIEMKLEKGFDHNWARRVYAKLRYIQEETGGAGAPPPRKKAKSSDDDSDDDDSDDDDSGDGGSDVVGYLEGNLLPRPCSIFYQMADAISGELQGLACLFCESDGRSTRIKHPALQEQGAEAVGSGGFFHIEKVEVRKQHKGKDLSLHLMHHTLVFLDDLWTLAVMEPAPLQDRYLRWSDNDRLDLPLRDPFALEVHPDDKEKIKRGNITVQRHYARMGFTQAGRSRNTCDAFFLTKQSYLDERANAEDAIATWIPKERADTEIDVFYPPPTRNMSALDKELKTELLRLFNHGAPSSETDLSALKDILRRGASLDTSCAMHVAAANTRGADMFLLEELIRLGGDVNASDEDGNRPLHVAASMKKSTVVRHLIGCGADVSATDLDGSTPLDAFQKGLQSLNDFATTFGLHRIREAEILPKLETAKALMSQEQRNSLIDGWMSPRMHHCLLITAELDADVLTDNYCGAEELFSRNQPTPLKDVCQSWVFSRIEYIPMRVLQSDERGIFRSFYDGWAMIFEAILRVLERREAPTVIRIRSELNSDSRLYDLRKLQHYEGRGGKIEYALDAVMKSTENVVKTGDDGWVYEDHEEDIEGHPANPLDEMYDVARLMCFNRGGGELEECGPYRDVRVYGLDDD